MFSSVCSMHDQIRAATSRNASAPTYMSHTPQTRKPTLSAIPAAAALRSCIAPMPQQSLAAWPARLRVRSLKSHIKSQRPPSLADTRPRPATEYAGRRHTQPQQAPSSHCQVFPDKEEVDGSSPSRPTKQDQVRTLGRGTPDRPQDLRTVI